MTRISAARPRRGFSLVEIAIAMTLVAALTGLAAVSLAGRSEESLLRRDAALAASLAASARLAAITKGRIVDLALSPEADALAVEGGEARRLRSGVSAALIDSAGARAERLSFYPGGGSSGGAIALSGSNAGIVIAIDWLTGEARVGKPRALADAAH
jgi:general secretion pathway protein H